MNDFKKQTIVCDDLFIDIQYNPSIKNKPYLVRFYSYDCCSEHRLDQQDLLKLNGVLANFAVDNHGSIEYNPEHTSNGEHND